MALSSQPRVYSVWAAVLLLVLTLSSMHTQAPAARPAAARDSAEEFNGDLQKPWHGEEIPQLDDGVIPQGRITYELNGDWRRWPADKREKIVKSMDEAVWLYNRYGRFEKRLRATYNPNVKTADGSSNGQIRFGKQISTRTALHEISHTLGIGTSRRWKQMFEDKTWTGHHATRMLQAFDGHEAKLKGDKSHFWPYGLNYAKGDSPVTRIRHVLMVEAICRDMDLPVFAQID